MATFNSKLEKKFYEIYKDGLSEENNDDLLQSIFNDINKASKDKITMYARLIDYKLKQDEVAEKVSKSRVAVTNSLRLLKLDERVQKMVIDDMISGGHARALLAVSNGDTQYALAMKAFDEKLSVREVEKLIKNIGSEETKKPKDKPKDDFVYRDIESKLKEIIGTKVVIHNKNNNKGKIEIEYYSQDDFERIIELIKK